jgi:hypothetical protein
VLHAQAERDVATDVAVGEQCVVLEHQSEPAPVGWHLREVVTVPLDGARRRGLEARDRAQE